MAASGHGLQGKEMRSWLSLMFLSYHLSYFNVEGKHAYGLVWQTEVRGGGW